VTLALSEPLRENLVNVGGMPKTCVRVTPVGLDLRMYPAAPRTKEEGTGETARSADDVGSQEVHSRIAIVGCVARLDERHGVEYLIRAAKLVHEKMKEVEFFVLGTGPFERRLRALAKELTVRGRVTFLGDDVTAEELLPNVDVFVLPALKEAIGIEALQAMACARPVVATGVGGVFRVVRDGQTGFIVPPADEEALAAKVLALLAAPQLRRDLGRAGREIVEHEFRLDAMVGAAEEAYKRAMRE
jgi:glycosyltransferase involved in cell wall biosynthesis